MSNDWIYLGQPYIEGPINEKEYFGFVYRVTNNVSGKYYIGVKYFFRPTYRMVNKKRKKIMVQSDWKDYWSSSEALNADVIELGKDKFTREILHLVRFKGMCKYIETREIMDRRCLELSEDQCYNSFVGMKIHRRCVRL